MTVGDGAIQSLKSSTHRAIRLTRRFPRQVARSRGLYGRSESPAIAYIGYSHFVNVGDDLIYESHDRTLNCDLIPAPTENERPLLRLARLVRSQERVRGVLLGGGTIVGRSEWRRRVVNTRDALESPVIATGVGVEDPEFTGGRRNYEDFSELEQWRDVFADSPHVSVRGPRSQELLWRVGIESKVVSDTALILAPEELTIERENQPRIGVSFAVAGDENSADYKQCIRECMSALRKLTSQRWLVSLFVFDRRDLPLTTQIAKSLGPNARIESTTAIPSDILPKIEQCDVFIGQRLHSVVMASAVGVPAIALEYQPKCRDFQLSIGREEWTLSIRDITSSRLLSEVQALAEARESHSAAIRSAVLEAKRGLLEDQRNISQLLGIGGNHIDAEVQTRQ